MRYFLLFLALFVQLNASGYTDYNPQKNCAQKILPPESSDCGEQSYVLFRYQEQYEDAEPDYPITDSVISTPIQVITSHKTKMEEARLFRY